MQFEFQVYILHKSYLEQIILIYSLGRTTFNNIIFSFQKKLCIRK